ncbi:Zinc finger, ZZ type [Popillia japonica]|uniref:Zinc finger, ZZ type n=1 Tax=Popillia japonica TaxID=7064 RepID=A0AAW1MC33_POPJA
MSENHCITLKIFLKDKSGTIKVKKYVVNGDTYTITNFTSFREKLSTAFPKLKDVDIKITWEDADGDNIALENDEDFRLAFTEMSGSLKTLSVEILDSKPALLCELDVICDMCQKRITAYRYKCLQCRDYDLCKNCEYTGYHSDHVMLRTSTKELFVKYGCKIVDQISKVIE